MIIRSVGLVRLDTPRLEQEDSARRSVRGHVSRDVTGPALSALKS